MEPVLMQTSIPTNVATLFTRGKVRDIYDLGRMLLIITTDRISAFDVILLNGIPGKGKVLTAMSVFWFDYVKDIIANHLVTADFAELIRLYPSLEPYADQLEGRFMLVKKADRIDVECIVRGHITGSGWGNYKKDGTICGLTLPEGLLESQKLPENLFTPSTKAESGHDENVSFDAVVDMIGMERASEIRGLSLAVYEKARLYAEKKNIIIADTKFEFGRVDGKTIMIDEILSPDSSRFWPKAEFKPGRSQTSLDKQYVRDYLNGLDWDKTSPAPELPDDVVDMTAKKYQQALRMLIG